jgi:hypothetical protein
MSSQYSEVIVNSINEINRKIEKLEKCKRTIMFFSKKCKNKNVSDLLKINKNGKIIFNDK